VVRLWAGQLGNQGSVPRHNDQISSGAHPAFSPMGARVIFVGVKQPGREADYLLPPDAKIKNAWSCAFPSSFIFMVSCFYI
jgi:hypothetical protein